MLVILLKVWDFNKIFIALIFMYFHVLYFHVYSLSLYLSLSVSLSIISLSLVLCHSLSIFLGGFSSDRDSPVTSSISICIQYKLYIKKNLYCTRYILYRTSHVKKDEVPCLRFYDEDEEIRH